MNVKNLRETFVLATFSRRGLGDAGHGVASCPNMTGT
jgi:hypothetical protein